MRDKLLHTAILHFLRYGIKSVSIEEIARSLHISKRTLYEYFDSKTELLIESFRYGVDLKKREIETNLSTIESPLEAILVVYTTASKHTCEVSAVLLKETERYPEIANTSKEYLSFLEQKWRSDFEQAIRKGLLLPDSDHRILCNFFINQKEALRQNDKATDTIRLANNLEIVVSCLKGMCTEEGKKELLQTYETIKSNNLK